MAPRYFSYTKEVPGPLSSSLKKIAKSAVPTVGTVNAMTLVIGNTTAVPPTPGKTNFLIETGFWVWYVAYLVPIVFFLTIVTVTGCLPAKQLRSDEASIEMVPKGTEDTASGHSSHGDSPSEAGKNDTGTYNTFQTHQAGHAPQLAPQPGPSQTQTQRTNRSVAHLHSLCDSREDGADEEDPLYYWLSASV